MRLTLLAAASILASTAYAGTFKCTAPNALVCCGIFIGGGLGLTIAAGADCVSPTGATALQGPGACPSGFQATCCDITLIPTGSLLPGEFLGCADPTVVV